MSYERFRDVTVPAGLRVEYCGIVRDVFVLVLGHLWEGVVGLEDGQGLTEELKGLGLHDLTEMS